MADFRVWSGSGVTPRANSTVYALGARMVPAYTDASTNHNVAKRWVWECTTAGTSGAAVPAWSASYTKDVSTITDGTVTWTCRRPGISSGTTVDWTFATIYADYGWHAIEATADRCLIQYNHQEQRPADINSTTAQMRFDGQIISVDKDASEVYRKMWTTESALPDGWIGHSTNPVTTEIRRGNGSFQTFGLCIRTGGATADTIQPTQAASAGQGVQGIHTDMFMFNGATVTNTHSVILGGGADARSFARYINCWIRHGAVTSIGISGNVELIGGGISSAGTAITTVFRGLTTADSSGATLYACGFNLATAGVSSTATICGDTTITPLSIVLDRCDIPTSATRLQAQTVTNQANAELTLLDCNSGDTHGIFEYHNALGSITPETTIFFTGTPANISVSGVSTPMCWRVASTANCNINKPFVSPWIGRFIGSAGSITPFFEIFRDASTTPYTDAQVWAEWTGKITLNDVMATFASDSYAQPFGSGTNQAAGAGTSAWATGNAADWSGKIDSGSALSIQEPGQLGGRIVVAAASTTVFVDPFIRT